jgi:hypothetical protein
MLRVLQIVCLIVYDTYDTCVIMKGSPRKKTHPQAFLDALSATIKQGGVVSASQAEMEDKMEAIVKNTPWVDITMGMELGEQAE